MLTYLAEHSMFPKSFLLFFFVYLFIYLIIDWFFLPIKYPMKNKKSPGGFRPRRFPLPLRVQNTLRSLKVRAQVV